MCSMITHRNINKRCDLVVCQSTYYGSVKMKWNIILDAQRIIKGTHMIVCVLLVSNSRGCCLAAPGDHEGAALPMTGGSSTQWARTAENITMWSGVLTNRQYWIMSVLLSIDFCIVILRCKIVQKSILQTPILFQFQRAETPNWSDYPFIMASSVESIKPERLTITLHMLSCV